MMNAVPAERSGGAAALQETAYELGNVLGIAVIVSITSFIYSNNLVSNPLRCFCINGRNSS